MSFAQRAEEAGYKLSDFKVGLAAFFGERFTARDLLKKVYRDVPVGVLSVDKRVW